MTSSRIHRVPFDRDSLAAWAATDPRSANWPVVYTIDGLQHVYVGETVHVLSRMRQHLARGDRSHLTSARVVIDEMFNKSVCLDLESFLIKRFSGDGKYEVLNANAGMTGSDYYQRETYRQEFEQIFEQLRAEGLFDKSAVDIENSDMFKLSPYKELNYDQRTAILAILEQLFSDLRSGQPSTAVIEGQPGTGKTIIGIYLIKLLSDIQLNTSLIDADSDAIFAGFFTQENAVLLEDFRMALVIPQQSLRKTVEKVFAKTSGLSKSMVLSPFQVGDLGEPYDLLIVDEAHRLQQLSATMPTLITKFKATNKRLFNGDEAGGNQLDWMLRMSTHRIFLLDPEQSIRPTSDLPPHVVRALAEDASTAGRSFALTSQMRVRAGQDYVAYVRAMLSASPPEPTEFGEYELKLFDDLGAMREAIMSREHEVGLSRLVAGFAWKWRSKTDKNVPDIQIDGVNLQWNNTATDWISSASSINEVGSIHTTQGYDLNYAGVIIGPDLRYDPDAHRLRIDRDSYHDGKGKANNKMLGFEYDDEDLLGYIRNIYGVLLTRGIRGTYVYVCDPPLREYISKFIPAASDVRAPADVMHPRRGELGAPENAFEIELGAPPSSKSDADSPGSR